MQRIKGFNEKVKNALISKDKKPKKPKAGPKVVAATPNQAPASKPLPKGFKVVERYPNSIFFIIGQINKSLLSYKKKNMIFRRQ